MIAHHDEQCVFIKLVRLRFAEEVPERPVRVLHRVLTRLLLLGNASFRIREGPMVGDRQQCGEERPAGGLQPIEFAETPAEQVFVTDAPRVCENGINEVRLLKEVIEPVICHERADAVEEAPASGDEEPLVAPLLQHASQREDPLGVIAFEDRLDR